MRQSQRSTGGKIPAGAGEQLFSRGRGYWFLPGPGIFDQDLEPSPTCWSYEIIWKLRKIVILLEVEIFQISICSHILV